MSRNTFVLSLLALLIALFLQFRPIDDVDLFWQIRTGLLMLETGRLVDRDVFTYTHAGEPVPPISWLAQLLFALPFAFQVRLGGLAAVRLVTSLAFAAALGVAAAPRRREVGWFSLTAAVVLGLLVALPHTSVRPQAFGVLGFALLLALVQRAWPGWLRLAGAVPLLVVWQNLHPSVVVGGIAVAAVVATQWLRFFRTGKRPAPWTLTALLVLIGLSQFATPLGWSILAVSRQNAVVARDWLRVSEWMPPWDASVRDAMATFWMALLISLLLLARLRFRIALDDLALFAVMTLLALSAARFALFWAIAAVPMWARWIEAAKPHELFPARDVAVPYMVAVPAVGLGLLFVCLPLYLMHRQAWPMPLMSDKLPSDGASRLWAVTATKRIYNYREWGGLLVSLGQNPRQVAIDGRLYLFSKEEWDEYNRAALGQIPLKEIIEKHHPDAFFLRPGFHAALIASLRQAKEWVEIHSDSACAVFVPASRFQATKTEREQP